MATTTPELNRLQETFGWLSEVLSNGRVLTVLTIAPAVVLFTVVSIIPISWAIASSFHEIGLFTPTWEWTGLTHYEYIVADEAFWHSMWLSVVYAVISVVGQVVIGVGLALAVNRQFSFSRLTRALVMLPYMVPTAVLALVALWMGNPDWGVINQLPVQWGLLERPIDFFGETDKVFGLVTVNMIAVSVVGWWKWSAFVLIFVLARLQSIPDELYEAAKICGATTYQMFRDITLPNLKGVLFIVIFLRGIWMFNKFDIIFVLTQGGPLDTTTIAPIHAYETAFELGSLGRSGAIASLLFAMLIVYGVVYMWTLNPEEEVRVE